ncbi:MAG: SDR family NAD(P)-dependent oxidoreductase, partial [Chitinophagaceae bacterium]
VKGDIRKENHCKKIVQKAIKEFGSVDILVNNAAFQMSRETIMEIPTEEWIKTFDTNIHPMFYLCKAAVPHMKKGSSIINTTSVNAYNPSEVLLPYAATKGAIQNFTSNLSQILLLQGTGIRVNAVAPGPVWTPLKYLRPHRAKSPTIISSTLILITGRKISSPRSCTKFPTLPVIRIPCPVLKPRCTGIFPT